MLTPNQNPQMTVWLSTSESAITLGKFMFNNSNHSESLFCFSFSPVDECICFSILESNCSSKSHSSKIDDRDGFRLFNDGFKWWIRIDSRSNV